MTSIAARASDRERDHTAERLRRAAAEGHLLPDELEQRLHTAFSARTYAELDAIVSDLPSPARRRLRACYRVPARQAADAAFANVSHSGPPRC